MSSDAGTRYGGEFGTHDNHVTAPHVDLSFWGKAQPDRADRVAFHPVAYHLLDVAAVAEAIFDVRPLTRARAGWLLGIDAEKACKLLVALIALHDLGKFSPAFQVKCAELWPAALGACDPERIRGTRHTSDGFTFWDRVFAPMAADCLWPNGRAVLRALAPAIFGHHGRPVGGGAFGASATQVMGEAGLAAAQACGEAVLSLLHPTPIDAPDLTTERARLASWWVAGLTTVSDWVGSNQPWFAYTAPLADDSSLAAYWARARAAAERAVREAGLVAPTVSPLRTFSELTHIEREPSPAQRWASDVDLPDGPLLTIIEDVTGSGKTEAAQMLVHRLMVAGRASGAYWAMPTQATANAMYGRQAETIAELYVPGPGIGPSLVLAHGQQRLHEGFRATVLGSASSEVVGELATSDDEMTGTAGCAAFLADDRRAALLADVGAGTIDQALLGVLPAKFNAVRLFGLSEKVLVVDEAHAYDAYMGVEVQELLRFQAALGGCAVVLSATLAREQREQMVVAWTEGTSGGARRARSWREPAMVELTRSNDYPLATLVAADTVGETALEAAPWSSRTVPVRLVSAFDEALEYVVNAATLGGAVAWVRNTVDDCLAAADMLRARGLEPLVFHARFAQGDRQRRESEVLKLFGTGATAVDRRGRVVVATQVIEQSLDLDFDAMVSDVAPIDFLIQRAGRLRRHPHRNAERPGGVTDELVVLAPTFVQEAPADWLSGVFKGTSRVYKDAGVLWRTVGVLSEAKAIETPNGLRVLIERVYGSAEVPEALLAAAQRAEGEESGNAAAANYATLKVTDGYDASAQGWVSDLRARTRLGEDYTTVRLARLLADGELAPWIGEGSPAWKAWALSEVRLHAWKVPSGSKTGARFDGAVARVRAEWGVYEQEITVLPLLQRSATEFEGHIELPESSTVRGISYDQNWGLRFNLNE